MDKKLKTETLLLISVLIISTCSLVYELVAGALASYLLGDSVKQFSFIIGTYLFAMGIGSFLSKYIKTNIIARFIEVELLVGVVGGFSAVVLFLLFQHVIHFQLILFLFVFIIGCLVGLEIPLLMTILKNKIEFSDLVSNVFTFDYIGALIASVLFPILLIPKLGVIGTSLFFGVINVCVALILTYTLGKNVKSIFYLRIKGFLALFGLLVTLYFSKDILQFVENDLYAQNILYKHSTQYQRIVLTENKDHYQLFLNNNLQFSTKDEYRYHEMLVHPAMLSAKKIENILVLGGGDGLAVREILKYNEVKKVVLVDLDKGMTDLFKSNPKLVSYNKNALNDAKVTVYNQDAYMWIKQNSDKFDVIIIDFPDPSNYSLGKLYTNNFYGSLQNQMSPNTIVSVQTTSPYFAPKSFWSIYKTIESVYPNVLPYHAYVPSFGEWGFNLFSNNMQIKLDRKVRNAPKLKFYNLKLTDYSLFPEDMIAKDVEVNRLDNQILVRYFDEEWSKI